MDNTSEQVREISEEAAAGGEGRVLPRIFRRDFTSSADDDESDEEESEEESDDEWVFHSFIHFRFFLQEIGNIYQVSKVGRWNRIGIYLIVDLLIFFDPFLIYSRIGSN